MKELDHMSIDQIKRIINKAVKTNKLDAKWKAPDTVLRIVLARHIRDFCNELGYIIQSDGTNLIGLRPFF